MVYRVILNYLFEFLEIWECKDFIIAIWPWWNFSSKHFGLGPPPYSYFCLFFSATMWHHWCIEKNVTIKWWNQSFFGFGFWFWVCLKEHGNVYKGFNFSAIHNNLQTPIQENWNQWWFIILWSLEFLSTFKFMPF